MTYANELRLCLCWSRDNTFATSKNCGLRHSGGSIQGWFWFNDRLVLASILCYSFGSFSPTVLAPRFSWQYNWFSGNGSPCWQEWFGQCWTSVWIGFSITDMFSIHREPAMEEYTMTSLRWIGLPSFYYWNLTFDLTMQCHIPTVSMSLKTHEPFTAHGRYETFSTFWSPECVSKTFWTAEF